MRQTRGIQKIQKFWIGKVFNRADAFVMTSIQEGQPVSAMEAACCGLPIFSTRCGGVEDYVDEKIGRIYNVTDYEGMAQGLKDFLEGKITFDSQYIRSQIVKQFGKKAFVANFTTAFDGVIERWEQR
jgi:glycosyltransferase involved in cell wall biosynthesis